MKTFASSTIPRRRFILIRLQRFATVGAPSGYTVATVLQFSISPPSVLVLLPRTHCFLLSWLFHSPLSLPFALTHSICSIYNLSALPVVRKIIRFKTSKYGTNGIMTSHYIVSFSFVLPSHLVELYQQGIVTLFEIGRLLLLMLLHNCEQSPRMTRAQMTRLVGIYYR